MLNVNTDTVGKAAIIECEGIIMGSGDALQLHDAVTGRSADQVIVIDLSKVSVTTPKGSRMLMFLQRWARRRGIQLKLFNPCPAVRDAIEHAGPTNKCEFASLGEVMEIIIRAGEQQLVFV